MIAFKEWLVGKENDNSNIGDLARDVKRDAGFPNVHDKERAENYLIFNRASPQAMQAFYGAWKTYISEFERSREKEKVISTKINVSTNVHLEEYMEKNKLKSKSSAIDFLIQVGLAQ